MSAIEKAQFFAGVYHEISLSRYDENWWVRVYGPSALNAWLSFLG